MDGAQGRWLLASILLMGCAIPVRADERSPVSLTRQSADQEDRGRLQSTTEIRHERATAAKRLSPSKTTSASEPRKSKPDRPWHEIDDPSVTQPAWLGNAPRDALTQQLVGRTLLVTTVFAGVGLLVVAIAHRVQVRRRSSGQTGSMALLDTLHLAPRCTLQLIRIDSQKFLVARDAGGVRSVTPVQSFAETIDQVTTGNPLEEAVAQSETWDHGLSLETPYRNKDVSTPLRSRRIDSWQENSWNR